MGHDGLALLQELVGDRDAFVQQPAGILAQIQDQALDVVFAEPLAAALPVPGWCSR